MHCVNCGLAFGKRARCYVCSPARPRARVAKTCTMCGGAFEVQVNQDRRGEGRYCSRTCHYRAASGIELVTGTRSVLKSGYVAVKVGIRRYKLEHRLVMETILGRELIADEQVHHINGDKQDNRPDNLTVLTNAEHQRLHAEQGDSVIGRRSRVSLICDRCGQEYEKRLSCLGKSRYCSNACRLAALHEGNRKPVRTAVA